MLIPELLRARKLTQRLNKVDHTDLAAIGEIVKELFGKVENTFNEEQKT